MSLRRSGRFVMSSLGVEGTRMELLLDIREFRLLTGLEGNPGIARHREVAPAVAPSGKSLHRAGTASNVRGLGSTAGAATWAAVMVVVTMVAEGVGPAPRPSQSMR